MKSAGRLLMTLTGYPQTERYGKVPRVF